MAIALVGILPCVSDELLNGNGTVLQGIRQLPGGSVNVDGNISMNKKTLYKGEAQITQFGTREGLAPIMFEDKKAPVKVYFYPETGAIKQIIQ